jgi:tetratricopeptide (TPR) repeat protein
VTEQSDAVIYRAESYLELGQVERADELLQTAFTQDPENATILLRLAQVRERQQRWSEVIDCAQSALALQPNSTFARLLIAGSARQVSDLVLMREQVDAVLAQQPRNALGLMYLAILESSDRTPEGKARVRALYAQSLEYSDGGTPWLIRSAAHLEEFMQDRPAALALLDSGLERFPTDSKLLAAKASSTRTPLPQKLSILEGLLASSPTDPDLRAPFSSLLFDRRRAAYSVLWQAPLILTTSFVFLDGWWRLLGLLPVGLLWWAVWNPARQKSWMSPVMRSIARPRRRWRGIVRVSTYISAASAAVGGALLGADLAVGAWLIAVALLGWVVVRVELLGHEKAEARQIDTEIVALLPEPPSEAGTPRPLDETTYAPTSMKVRDGRRGFRILAVVLLFPFAGVAGIALSDSPTNVAAYALGLVVSVVATTMIIEPMQWRWQWEGLLGRIILMYLPVTFYVGLLVGMLGGLVAVTVHGEDAFPTPNPVQAPEQQLKTPEGEPKTPEEVEELMDRLDSPAPSSVPVPTFTFPTFDIPTLPPAAPPAG